MMRSITLAVACVLVVGGCRAESGAVLELTGVLAPSATCTFSATGTEFLSSGSYDPRGYGSYAPLGFAMGVRLLNNTLDPASDPIKDEAGRPLRTTTNDIHIAGFDVCWDLADRHAAYGAGVLDCGTLPTTQRAFVASSAVVTTGTNPGVAIVDVLQPQHLAAPGIFGTGFDARSIPALPTVVDNTSFSELAQIASVGGRAPAWGDFPGTPTNTARIIVGLSAVGKTLDGRGVSSNVLTFPIDVTVGLISATCGAPTRCGTTNNYAGDELDVASCPSTGRFECTTTTCPTP